MIIQKYQLENNSIFTKLRLITFVSTPFLRVEIRGKVTKDQLSRLDTVTLPYVIHSFTLSKKRRENRRR